MKKKAVKLRGSYAELLPSGLHRIRWRDTTTKQLCTVTVSEPDSPETRAKVARLVNLVAAYRRDGRDPWQLFGGKEREPCKLGLSFKDHLERWQARRSPFTADGQLIKDARVRPTTWLHDESTLKHLVDGMGHLDVFALKRSDFEDLVVVLQNKKRADGKTPLLSGTTIAKITALAHAALQSLVEDGDLPRNPAPKTKAIKSDSLDRRPLEPETITKFIEALPASITLEDGATISGAMLRAHYQLWSRTGMRSNEIGALQYGDLDLDRQVIHVRRGRSPRSYGQEQGLIAKPKNKKGRDLDCGFDPEIFRILERLRRESLAAGRPTWLFHDSNGRPVSEELLHKRCWRPTMRLLGLPEEDERQGSYILRHSFACSALSAGEDPGWVASFLGHDESVLWARYRKYIKTNRSTPGAAFAARMRQALTQKTETLHRCSMERSV